MEEGLKELILKQSEKYPRMRPEDYVKLLYQNEFGCSHLLPDLPRSVGALQREFDSLPDVGESQFRSEPIGNGLCRVFFGRGPQGGELLPLLSLFLLATARTYDGDEARFRKKLKLLESLAGQGLLPVGGEEVKAYVEQYILSGEKMVGHSREFMESYHPHYRVIKRSYVRFLTVFLAAVKLERPGRTAVLAIDGRCGSGKTYLAGLLKEVFGCSVFHVDDFFLPAEKRTPERLAGCGGNIDRERFLAEVLRPLSAGERVRYRPYSCMTGRMLEPVEERPGTLAVVEGSFSLHPEFRKEYDCKVFLTCSPPVQQRRIFLRGDGDLLHDFLETWIPAEEFYFDSMRIPEQCDLTVDTSGFDEL